MFRESGSLRNVLHLVGHSGFDCNDAYEIGCEERQTQEGGTEQPSYSVSGGQILPHRVRCAGHNERQMFSLREIACESNATWQVLMYKQIFV